MLQEEKDRKKIKSLPSKMEELVLLLEKTSVMRVHDFVATELIENEYEKYLQMFPASLNKSRSMVNVTRTPNRSRMNKTQTKEVSSRVFNPKKIEAEKPNFGQTVATKTSTNMIRNSGSKNTVPASPETFSYDEGTSRDLSSKKEDFGSSKSVPAVLVNDGVRILTSSHGLEDSICERDFRDNVFLNSTECHSFAAMRQVKNVDSPSQSRKSPALKSIKRARGKSQCKVYRRAGLH